MPVGFASQSLSSPRLVPQDNLLRNGGFEIWQRGVGPFTTSGLYTADGWLFGAGGTSTFSLSQDTANKDAGSQYCAAVTFTHAASGDSSFQQPLEDYRQLLGRTLSFSIRVKTSTANAVRIGFNDRSAGAVGNSGYHSGSGNYETLRCTATIPASWTGLCAFIELDASCTAYFDNAMLVVGSVPQDYVPQPITDEVLQCQRYYEVIGAGSRSGVYFSVYSAAGQSCGYTLRWVPKPSFPSVTKVGTWNVTNCGQPAVTNIDVESAVMFVVVTALGQAQFYNAGPTTYLTLESNI